jgi:hypothetical protein
MELSASLFTNMWSVEPLALPWKAFSTSYSYYLAIALFLENEHDIYLNPQTPLQHRSLMPQSIGSFDTPRNA